MSDKTIQCDFATGQLRPIVPLNFRTKVFKTMHNLSHTSVLSTRDFVAKKFIWHDLKKQVVVWAMGKVLL